MSLKRRVAGYDYKDSVEVSKLSEVNTLHDQAVVREHLARLLASPQFSGSARLSRFLQYCVDSALEDPGGRIKEFDIAEQVFGRDSSFDSRLDPIVRVQAVRLRAKLKEYYHESGREESLRISLPKGAYVVSFESATAETEPEVEELVVVEAPTEPAIAPASHPNRWVIPMLAAIATVAVVGFVLYSRSGKPASATPVQRRSVAVVYFRNLSKSPESDWLATALSEMLNAELGSSAQIRTIPGQTVARMKADLKLPDDGEYSKDTLERIRRNVGSDLVLVGSYLPVGGKLRLDVHLQETRSGDTIESFTRTDEQSNLLALVSAVGARIRARLGASPASPTEELSVKAATPSNEPALRLYAEGLQRLEQFDALKAKETLERAVAADPTHPLSHAALSDAWSRLGYDAKAAAEAAQAQKLSKNLSREESLLVEGRADETSSQWPRAVDVYQGLWSFFPDKIDYALLLANAQTKAGQAKKALAIVETLRKKNIDDARIDLAEAAAADQLADNRRAVTAAEHAEQLAHANGSRLLEAEASIAKGNSLTHLTDYLKARPAFENAIAICQAVGNAGCVASAQMSQGFILSKQGDLDSADQLLKAAFDTAQRIGDHRSSSRVLTSMGNLARSRADLPGAGRLFQQALDVARETGDRQYIAVSLNNLANISNNTGHPDMARTQYKEGLAIAREIDDRTRISVFVGNLAILDYSEGHLAEARKELEEALALKRETGDRSSYAYSLGHMATVLELQGDLAGSRKVLKEECGIYDTAGERIPTAHCTLAFAGLDLHENHPDSALAIAQKIAGQFTTVDPDAEAWRLIAMAYLQKGQLKEARTAIAKAEAIASKSVNASDFRLPISVSKARVDAAAGDQEGALKTLEESLAAAEKLNKIGLQLQIRLTILEVRKAHGAEVAKFVEEARRMGYGLYADEAKALL